MGCESSEGWEERQEGQRHRVEEKLLLNSGVMGSTTADEYMIEASDGVKRIFSAEGALSIHEILEMKERCNDAVQRGLFYSQGRFFTVVSPQPRYSELALLWPKALPSDQLPVIRRIEPFNNVKLPVYSVGTQVPVVREWDWSEVLPSNYNDKHKVLPELKDQE